MCLLELYTAATAGIPIVSLVCSGKGYDFAAAEDHVLHLDTSLPASNPSAVGVLEANEAPVLRVAQVLWACLPNIISVPLNSAGSDNAIRAAVADLVKAMQRAVAIPAVPSDNESAWLDNREARDRAALAKVIASSTIRGSQRGRMVERADEMADKIADLKRSAFVYEAKLKNERERCEAERERCEAVRKNREVEHKVELAGAMSKLEAKNEKLEAKIVRLEEIIRELHLNQQS